MQETWVLPMVPEDPLEEETATHSSILGWRIPWTEERVGYSPWGHREPDMTECIQTRTCLTDNAVLASGVVCIC